MNAVLNRANSVLIVDADLEGRAFFKEQFESNGFTVTEAESTAEALAKVSTDMIDVVVLDLELPRAKRLAFVDALNAQSRGPTLLVLLASPFAISREEAYDLGAAIVFSKPVDPSYLMGRIRELLVPAPTRWRQNANKSAPVKAGRKKIALSVRDLVLGRGGFTLPLSEGSELLEGDMIDFDVEVNGNTRWNLRGTGVIRYVKFDEKKRHQRAWGIEFKSLDEDSVERVLAQHASGMPRSYIPRSVH